MLKFLPRLRIKTSVVVLYSTHCSLTIRYSSQVFTIAFKMKVSALLQYKNTVRNLSALLEGPSIGIFNTCNCAQLLFVQVCRARAGAGGTPSRSFLMKPEQKFKDGYGFNKEVQYSKTEVLPRPMIKISVLVLHSTVV